MLGKLVQIEVFCTSFSIGYGYDTNVSYFVFMQYR